MIPAIPQPIPRPRGQPVLPEPVQWIYEGGGSLPPPYPALFVLAVVALALTMRMFL